MGNLSHNSKKAWNAPELIVHGSIENVTGWIGGWFGEFFGGQGSGWNPWKPPAGGTNPGPYPVPSGS